MWSSRRGRSTRESSSTHFHPRFRGTFSLPQLLRTVMVASLGKSKFLSVGAGICNTGTVFFDSCSILVRFTEILREVHQTPSLPGQAMGAPAVVCITLGPLRFTPALYHEQLLRERALRVGRGLCERRWNARGARRGWRIGGWYLQRRNTDSRSHHHRERFFKLVQVKEALKSVVLRTTRFVGAKVTRLCRKLESAEKIVSFVLGTILVTLANWKTLSPSRCETRRLSPLDQRAAQSLVDIPALRKYVHQ